MTSAATAITEFLTTAYEIPDQNVFLQGSYANRTAVEPVDGGEYDIDLVCVCIDDLTESNAALDGLEELFRDDGRFRDRVKTKKPCVRLEYAEDDVGSFHVDVVPVRVTGEASPPLEAPRHDEGWHGTAPAEYTQWCQSQGVRYMHTVMAMKRWRDEQQSVRAAIKSIVLQVLVAGNLPQVADDASRLAETLRMLHARLRDLSTPPTVLNPVLTSENLANRWTQESFRSFVTELAEAVEWANMAEAATDEVEAADAWREILGDDFPVLGPDQLGFRVSDFSHAKTPTDMGWRENTDPRYTVGVQASVQRGQRGQNRRPYADNGPLVLVGHKLRFKATVVAPNHVDVWWQVANTGGHARTNQNLRGEIFRGHNLNGKLTIDPTINWEDTRYTGSHLIRALLVRSSVVVAESSWFRVNIYAGGRRFEP